MDAVSSTGMALKTQVPAHSHTPVLIKHCHLRYKRCLSVISVGGIALLPAGDLVSNICANTTQHTRAPLMSELIVTVYESYYGHDGFSLLQTGTVCFCDLF